MNQVKMYYRTSLRRENLFQNFIYNIFLSVCSYPRLLLEVFVRKNFGQRYFRMSTSLTITLILLLMPEFFSMPRWALRLFGETGYYNNQSTQLSWYLFVGAFFVFSAFRYREIEKLSSGIDFNKFSLYSGDINKRFFQIPVFGKTDMRGVETFREPAFFFVIGAVLVFFNQKIGIVISISSIMYCISYFAAYKNGDDFIAGLNDERLMKEELYNSYVKNLPGEQCRGVRFYMDRPGSIEEAEKVAEYMQKPESEDSVFAF